MTTHADMLKVFEDYVADPTNQTLGQQVLAFLAYEQAKTYQTMEKKLVTGVGKDRLQCPNCLGTTEDKVGSNVPCHVCNVGIGPTAHSPGTLPKLGPGP